MNGRINRHRDFDADGIGLLLVDDAGSWTIRKNSVGTNERPIYIQRVGGDLGGLWVEGGTDAPAYDDSEDKGDKDSGDM